MWGVALVIQHALRMRHIVICGLPRSTIFFFKLCLKRPDFRKKTLLNIKVCEGRTDQRNAQINFSLINLLFLLQWLVTCKDFRLPEDGFNWVAETCRSNLNNNKLINEKLICAFRWSVLPSI